MQHFSPAGSAEPVNGNSLVIPNRSRRRSRGELACPERSRRVSRNLLVSADSDELQSSRSARHGKLINSADLVTALRVFRPPLVVTATLCDGRPMKIHCKKREEIRGEILWAAGPWRSSGDWWEQDAWSRDEWDIALQQEFGIAFYRLVHDLLSGRWLLEGNYD